MELSPFANAPQVNPGARIPKILGAVAMQAIRLPHHFLLALVLSACVLTIPAEVQAQVNPEVANCAELKNEATVTQADLCAAHIGCRFVLNVQKTCARAKGYLERLQTAIGEGTRTLFGYRKEVTPDAVFTAELGGDDRENERKLGGLAESQRQAQDIGARVRDVGSGDTLTGKGSGGTTWIYYGQVRDGKANGTGSRIFSSGDIQRGQFKDDEPGGAADLLYPRGDRYVGNLMQGKREGLYVFRSGKTEKGVQYSDGNFFGDQVNVDGTQFKGLIYKGVRVQGVAYRADGTPAEQGRYENGKLSVGTQYDTANNHTEVNLPAAREAAEKTRLAAAEAVAREAAEKTRLAAEAENQRKRDEAARAEQQFRASLQTMNAGQLFARADELNAQGDRTRAREVQRALISRFPDHPLAATAASQMAGGTGNPPPPSTNTAQNATASSSQSPCLRNLDKVSKVAAATAGIGGAPPELGFMKRLNRLQLQILAPCATQSSVAAAIRQIEFFTKHNESSCSNKACSEWGEPDQVAKHQAWFNAFERAAQAAISNPSGYSAEMATGGVRSPSVAWLP